MAVVVNKPRIRSPAESGVCLCQTWGGAFADYSSPQSTKDPSTSLGSPFGIGDIGNHLISFHIFLRGHEIMETGDVSLYSVLVMQESLAFGRQSP